MSGEKKVSAKRRIAEKLGLGGFDPIAVCINRPTFTWMVIFAIVVLGAASLRGIPVDLFPSVDFPMVVVSGNYAGSGPEETETLITKPLEEQLSTISGIESITSTVGNGNTNVRLQFGLNIPIRKAAEDVREKVNFARSFLPADLDAPTVQTFDPGAQPVMTYGFSGDTNLALSEYADSILVQRLEQIEGVGSVTVNGERLAEADVRVDAGKLSAYRLSARSLASTLTNADQNDPGGTLNNGGRDDVLQLQGKFKSIDQIANTYIPVPAGGYIQVRDIGEVALVQTDKTSSASVNGRLGIVIGIVKQSDANTVALAHAVKATVAQLVKEMPKGYKLDLVRDSSSFIEDAVNDLSFSVLWGGLLAVLIVWVFLLDWRATIIAAFAIPVSLIASVGVISMMHYTLNMMTMMALSLSVGLLIDDAIVVIDNIHRRLERGETPMVAAYEGTTRIALAVLAVTLSLCAVFGPIGMVKGIIARFMGPFALTVTVAVLVSMVVAFTLTPMLASRILRLPEPHTFGPARKAWERFYASLERFYERSLAFVLRKRFLTVSFTLALFFFSLYLIKFLGTEMVPNMDQGLISVNVGATSGASVDATQLLAKDLEEKLMDMSQVETVFTTVGNSPDGTVNSAQMTVRLRPLNEIHMNSTEAIAAMRPLAATAVGANVRFRSVSVLGGGGGGGGGRGGGGSGGGKGLGGAAITLKLKGGDLEDLKTAARVLKANISEIDGVTDVTDDMNLKKPEYDLISNRPLMMSSGISEADVMNTVRTLVAGVRIGQFDYMGQDRNVMLRLRKEDRNDLNAIMSLLVPTSGGVALPVRDLVDLKMGVGPASISRDGRMRVVTLSGSAGTRTLGEVNAEVQQVVNDTKLPDGVHTEMGGDAQQMGDSNASLKLMAILSTLFIYMVLASQFESLIHPLTIMFTVPLALIGAVFSLLVFHQTLSVISGIGILTLMGLVKKNAILLVDYTNQLRDEGMSMNEALMRAGPVRLRPILMTSFAMILGMLPMAMGVGAGAETRQAMGIAVVGGLLVSTMLTLLVVPVVYNLLDVFTERGQAERRAAKAARASLVAATQP